MPNREHRKFGIEIECYNIVHMPPIIEQLGWIIGRDGSISGSYAYEIKSEPLPATTESFRQVKQVMKAIREAGGRVNSSCGMHVHIGVENDVREKCIPGLFFSNLIERYASLENFTDMLVPPSRRGNRNQYCMSVGGLVTGHPMTLEQISCANTQEDIRNNLVRISRGYKLNITAYLRHGTVEFRHFGGTLNGTKAVAWIKFCLAHVNVCSKASLRDETLRKNYTERQLANPLLGIVSERTINTLRTRHDAMAATFRQ